jgi:hypothetical protein
MVSEQVRDRVSSKRNTPQLFAITDVMYKKFFENLDRLKEPIPAAVPANLSVANGQVVSGAAENASNLKPEASIASAQKATDTEKPKGK